MRDIQCQHVGLGQIISPLPKFRREILGVVVFDGRFQPEMMSVWVGIAHTQICWIDGMVRKRLKHQRPSNVRLTSRSDLLPRLPACRLPLPVVSSWFPAAISTGVVLEIPLAAVISFLSLWIFSLVFPSYCQLRGYTTDHNHCGFVSFSWSTAWRLPQSPKCHFQNFPENSRLQFCPFFGAKKNLNFGV